MTHLFKGLKKYVLFFIGRCTCKCSNKREPDRGGSPGGDLERYRVIVSISGGSAPAPVGQQLYGGPEGALGGAGRRAEHGALLAAAPGDTGACGPARGGRCNDCRRHYPRTPAPTPGSHTSRAHTRSLICPDTIHG